jgi:hypothetical protein
VPKLVEIQDTCEEALDAVLQLPAGQRAGWVIYILEGLDEAEERRPWSDVLEEVQDAIETRLEGGRW